MKFRMLHPDENCQLAAKLFQGQQGVTVKYWRGKGKFKK